MRSVLKKLEEIFHWQVLLRSSTQNWIIFREKRPERISTQIRFRMQQLIRRKKLFFLCA
ncbi:MAG: hypothetical protein CM1200mP30_29130 [Pseudomonadota bacterium]|nr:MAG: hypothetical protein CM1200mP30_29130 [Pseudomonadota bacterium]